MNGSLGLSSFTRSKVGCRTETPGLSFLSLDSCLDWSLCSRGIRKFAREFVITISGTCRWLNILPIGELLLVIIKQTFPGQPSCLCPNLILVLALNNLALIELIEHLIEVISCIIIRFFSCGVGAISSLLQPTLEFVWLWCFLVVDLCHSSSPLEGLGLW